MSRTGQRQGWQDCVLYGMDGSSEEESEEEAEEEEAWERTQEVGQQVFCFWALYDLNETSYFAKILVSYPGCSSDKRKAS